VANHSKTHRILSGFFASCGKPFWLTLFANKRGLSLGHLPLTATLAYGRSRSSSRVTRFSQVKVDPEDALGGRPGQANHHRAGMGWAEIANSKNCSPTPIRLPLSRWSLDSPARASGSAS